jgi:hypothetical protein
MRIQLSLGVLNPALNVVNWNYADPNLHCPSAENWREIHRLNGSKSW